MPSHSTSPSQGGSPAPGPWAAPEQHWSRGPARLSEATGHEAKWIVREQRAGDCGREGPGGAAAAGGGRGRTPGNPRVALEGRLGGFLGRSRFGDWRDTARTRRVRRVSQQPRGTRGSQGRARGQPAGERFPPGRGRGQAAGHGARAAAPAWTGAPPTMRAACWRRGDWHGAGGTALPVPVPRRGGARGPRASFH